MRKLAAVLFLAALSARADDSAITKSLAAAVAQTGIPGAAVVAVDKNGVIYSANFGLRDVEAKLPVTDTTRFYIASATKPFTALTAMLTIDVDAPVETLIPDLHPPRALTIRDLMTHRLGFRNEPAGFRTAYTGEFDTPTLFSLINDKSTLTPRTFSYDNLGYVITAFAIEKATGDSWKDAVAKRVLAPLGMTMTSTHLPPSDAIVAAPYIFDGEWKRAAPKSEKTMHAAGGMFATAGDLARFVRMEMNHGAGVFPKRVIDETQSPQIHLKRRFSRYDRFAYGLGWFLADYDGDLLMHHFGGYRGAQSHMSWMPDRGIGVIVLTNTDGPLAHSFASFVYDSLLKKADAQKKLDEDVQHFNDAKAKRAAMIAEHLEKALAGEGAGAPLSTTKDGNYVGNFGTIVVSGNRIAMGEMSSDLVLAKGATYVVHFAPDEPTLVTFRDGSLVWDGEEFKR